MKFTEIFLKDETTLEEILKNHLKTFFCSFVKDINN